MSKAREIATWGCAALLTIVASVGCSDDPAPSDGGTDAKATTDGLAPPKGDGPVTPPGDGPQPWADQGVLECAPGIPANCCELMRQHEQALAEAKLCTAGGKACTKLVAGDLPCGCKTFVNSESAAAGTMADLEAQWKSAGCPAGEGCSACQDPKSANCELLGGAQKCVDIL